jgi:hypothetical protein
LQQREEVAEGESLPTGDGSLGERCQGREEWRKHEFGGAEAMDSAVTAGGGDVEQVG